LPRRPGVMSNAESRLQPARYEPAQRSTLPREKPRLLVLAVVYCDGWTGREYGKNESTQNLRAVTNRRRGP
jgi:hypothetical protein